MSKCRGGHSLWEILTVLTIIGVLIVTTVPFNQEQHIRHQVTSRLSELQRAIAWTQFLAAEHNTSYVIQPLSHRQWDLGYRITRGKACDGTLGDTIKIAKWKKSVLDIDWHGFNRQSCLVVSPRLLSSRLNGSFYFSALGRRYHRLVINRIGRMRVE